MRTDLLLFINYDFEKLKQAFAKSLKELRQYVGFSLLDLERLTGINNPSLSRYENGKVEPSISQGIIIADAFQLGIEQFILYGLGLKEENSDCETIIDCFEAKIAQLCFDLGENMETSLKGIYPKVNIDKILADFNII